VRWSWKLDTVLNSIHPYDLVTVSQSYHMTPERDRLLDIATVGCMRELNKVKNLGIDR
jgi:hypothetical protein